MRTLIVAIAFLAGVANAQPSPNPLAGVWRVVETNSTGPNQNAAIQASGIYIFTAGYYSMIRLESGAPRKAVPTSTATADELRAMFGANLGAHSGKLEISGNKITLLPLVAKNPVVTNERRSYTFIFRVEGNTLWLTDASTAASLATRQFLTKLTRLE